LPEVIHAIGRDRGTFRGVEGVLDFMFWPRKNVGWYVEPGYEACWRRGEPAGFQRPGAPAGSMGNIGDEWFKA
jgi:hypothetical protein